MKVAIWGSYNYGNYGDDVMALQFAEHLKRLGVRPCVYRLDRGLAKKYSVDSTDSITELFEDSKFCIIGGGGMLVGEKTNSYEFLSNTRSTTLQKFEEDFHQLVVTSTQKKCPVYPISIGGDGRGVSTPLPKWRYEFLQGNCCKDSTVRLVEDIALISKLGKEAVYYPDVLWSVGEFWKIQSFPSESDQLNVGINLPDSRTNDLLVFQLNRLSKFRKNVVFHFIRTHLPNSPIDNELSPKPISPYIKNHVYIDPTSTLQFLSSLDLIVSHKLHLGLTALALGVPFYSFGGQEKTQTLLKSINAEFAVLPFSKSRLPKIYETLKLGFWLSNSNNIQQAKYKFDFSAIDGLKKLSWGHLNRLDQLVYRYS